MFDDRNGARVIVRDAMNSIAAILWAAEIALQMRFAMTHSALLPKPCSGAQDA